MDGSRSYLIVTKRKTKKKEYNDNRFFNHSISINDLI